MFSPPIPLAGLGDKHLVSYFCDLKFRNQGKVAPGYDMYFILVRTCNEGQTGAGHQSQMIGLRGHFHLGQKAGGQINSGHIIAVTLGNQKGQTIAAEGRVIWQGARFSAPTHG